LNAHYFSEPSLGASIGPKCCGDIAGTLGGFVMINGSAYGLTASHIFEAALKKRNQTSQIIEVEHPAPGDQPQCTNSLLSSKCSKPTSFHFGRLHAWSGRIRRRTTTFDNICEVEDEHKLVEIDWALVRVEKPGINTLPTPSIRGVESRKYVETTCRVVGCAEVQCVGRTSGYGLGFISEVPGLQTFKDGVRHREWAIEKHDSLSVKRWNLEGIGVRGDSGAWLIDRESNALVGQIWGTNKAGRGKPRIAFFTPIEDVFSDIASRPGLGSPALPVPPSEANATIQEPDPEHPRSLHDRHTHSLPASDISDIVARTAELPPLTTEGDMSLTNDDRHQLYENWTEDLTDVGTVDFETFSAEMDDDLLRERETFEEPRRSCTGGWKRTQAYVEDILTFDDIHSIRKLVSQRKTPNEGCINSSFMFENIFSRPSHLIPLRRNLVAA
jgi:hypothetical protein